MQGAEYVLGDARPGDAISYVEDVDRAPTVGMRLTVVAFPSGSPERPPIVGYRVAEWGAWEVIGVEADRAAPTCAKVCLLRVH